ncbi:hypothetical protein SEA_KELA_248 [Streptomyces phage Kela]|nr:hypothetical protein SEA_KELA_248 [Streptomyces phage Kela]
MEFMEPKRGDKVVYQGQLRTIEGFDEDHGTHLGMGAWISINEYEKNGEGVWVRTDSPRTYLIGEPYENYRSSRKGVAVIRPAVYQKGSTEKVITTSPCCTLNVRHLNYADVSSDLAKRTGGWSETCTQCGWHYAVSLVSQTNDPRLGLYGVRWESKGF